MKAVAGTYLGFDFGLRRIGIAVGQTLTASASDLVTITARDGKPDWDEIEKLIRQWQPEGLVVGLPVDLEGKDQDITLRARKFGRQLQGRFGLPVFWIDETLSSHAAQKMLNGRLAKKNKANIDRLSAKLILESWLSQRDINEEAL